MASASSNRYQSRLFSFIHKQSRLLTNRFNRAWKSLQAATSWITPIVFYPALPQETVKQKVRSLSETPLTVDTPIKQVLLLVEAMPSLELVNTPPSTNFLGFLRNKFFPKTNTKLVATTANSALKIEDNNLASSLIATRPQVRAIASQISNRELVLVSLQNEILNILTTEQQQVLQAQIISEVTTWRLQSLLPSNQDKLPERKSWLLAPVNLFNRIANWTQRDKQQEKLSVFSSSAIASSAARSAIASIDRNIAKFEAESLAPIASKTKAFQLQGLIWAAINYFFGNRTSKLLESTANNLDDPWLEMSDLFGNEDAAKQPLISENPAISTSYLPENKNFTRSSQELNKYSLQSLLNRWRQITQKKSTSLAVKTPQNAKSLSKASQQKTSSQLKRNNISQNLQPAVAINSSSLNLSNSVNSTSSENLEHTPEWIETPAIAMGYVKHPLEQLLEWLDLTMLWLENILLKFWHWLQQR